MTAPPRPPIVFVVRELDADWPGVAAWDEERLEREHARFRRGVANWIVQGYVRLRGPLEAQGFEVSIARTFRPGAICIVHRDDLRGYTSGAHACFVVAVRADRPRVHAGELEVVQNEMQVEGPNARWIPHWPQPGLVERDSSRGERVRNAVYYGRENSVPAWYRDPGFHSALEALGVSFQVRDDGWHDYRDVDLVLAHRDETPTMLANKPASKLVNAWLAGVPALLAPEPAFETLRRSPLDFLTTTDAESTVAATASLVRDPALYAAMVQNGRARAREFDVEAVRRRWLSLLFDEAVPAYAAWRGRNPLARYARFARALSLQSLESKRFRAQERREKRDLT